MLELVEEYLALVAAVCESRIVLKPVHLHDLATVTSALKARRTLSRVEVVDVSLLAHTNCKKMPSIAESDLSAILHDHRVIVCKRARQHVVEHKFVAHCGHDVESTRMEGNSCGFFTRRVLLGHLELLVSPVPDADVGR